MERLIIAAVIIAVVGVVAIVSRSRRTPDAPTQRRYNVPEQIDRSDFVRPDAPWLVAVFSSATCDVCKGVAERAAVLESSEVAVVEVEYDEAQVLHEKYQIEAVPTLLISDAKGVIRKHFLGPVNATDLWAAVAEIRDPGAAPGH